MAEEHHTHTMAFSARAALPSCPPLAAYLLNLMTIKQSNLCLSADVTTTAELLAVAEELGDFICVLKTHADIVKDFNDRTISQLKEIAERKHFLIFEDRKFADIGHTVQLQYTEGPLTIARWAEFVTVHVLPGPAIVTSLKQAAEKTINEYNTTVHTEISAGPAGSEPETPTEEAGPSILQQPSKSRGSDSSSHAADLEKFQMSQIRKHSIVSISTTISTRSEPMSPGPAVSSFGQPRSRVESIEDSYRRLGSIPYQRAALLLAQMSSAGNLLTESYTQQCLHIGRQNSDFVLGFISQKSLNVKADDNFITFTPGVKLLEPGADAGDGHGQQYRTPKQVIGKDGADVVIVGRGILNAENRIEEAERYRKEAWSAYEARVDAES